MLLRPAYLQGPYALCVSVRDYSFRANEETVDTPTSSSPIYDQDVKTSTSFWAELGCDKKYYTSLTKPAN